MSGIYAIFTLPGPVFSDDLREILILSENFKLGNILSKKLYIVDYVNKW